MVLRASAEQLYLCAGSGALFGPVVYDGAPPIHEQRCRWVECPYRGESWHRPQTGLPEPLGDFPAHLELCYCCASTLISSGSKFSSFFCDLCGTAVRQLKESVGRTVIPLGRHSKMNGIILSGAACRDPRLVEAFASAVQYSGDRIDRLWTWQREVVADHVAGMRLNARYVPAPAYLAFTAQHAAPKQEMFRQLCRYFGLEPVQDRPDPIDGEFARVRDIAITEAHRWASVRGLRFTEMTYQGATFLFADDCYHTSIAVTFTRDGNTYEGNLHARIDVNLVLAEGSDGCESNCIKAA